MSEAAPLQPPPTPVAVPVLAVDGLNAYYGRAHVLEDVGFEMGRESVAIVGRNGMGKTTLCNAIMGIRPPELSGSIRFEGQELVGRPSYRIAGAGIGYVPQGRRLFPSLTVDEHLRMIRAPGRARWSPDRVYELFPRLADRKRHGGAELSGGEQQMLAIGRALLTNPKLLVMDEPSEGLAPTIIEHLIESFRALEHEGVSILLIEQNLGVATALADRQLIMISGQIAMTAYVDAKDSWRLRWPFVRPHLHGSLESLGELARQRIASAGFVRPSEGDVMQLPLRYRFRCASDECTTTHELPVLDWEVSEMARLSRERYGPQWATRFRESWGARLFERFDVHLLVSSYAQAPSRFYVASVFAPPKEAEDEHTHAHHVEHRQHRAEAT